MSRRIPGDTVTRRGFLAVNLAAAAGSVLPADAFAQAYPNQPVKIVVPFPAAGGPLDTVAHLFAAEIQQAGGPGGVVENRVGAGGFVGTLSVLQAPPDGYTVLCAPGTLYALGQVLFNRPEFDPQKYEPIGVAAQYPSVMVGRPDLPFSNIAGFIAYAKQNPGKLSYGSQGVGTIGHLSMERIRREAGIELLHVPFRGSAPAVAGLLTGTVDVLIDLLTNTRSNIEASKFKLIVAGTPQRLKAFPNVSTIGEAIPGFDASTWVGFAAPPGTPREVTGKLNDTMKQMLARNREKLVAVDLTPVGGRAADMRDSIRETERRWSAVAKAVAEK